MTKLLNLPDFMGLRRYEGITRNQNIRYFDDDNFLKISVANEKYWDKIFQKSLPGYHKPWDYYLISNGIKIIVSNPLNATNNFQTAVVTKILKGYKTLNDFSFHEKSTIQIMKMIRKVLYNNAVAVSNGFIHADYNAGNILLSEELQPFVIDLEESIIDGYKCTSYYMAPNAVYLYGTKYLDDEKQVITCDKVTLLNMFLMILLNGKDYCSAQINEFIIKRNIKLLGLPEAYEKKYVDILVGRKLPALNDFFIDDFDDLIKHGYVLK